MYEPRYIKRGIINLTAKVKEDEKEPAKEIKFNLLVDEANFKNLPPDIQKNILEKELSKVYTRKVSGIYNMNLGFSYDDKDALKGFDYGNIFVEVFIPYCLNLPNHYDFEILLSKPSKTALVSTMKIWTHKAKSDTKLSDNTDFYAEDEVLHFRNSDILTPKVPVDPKDGWQHKYTGTNLQKIKDTDGNFRFSRLYVQFNLDVKKEDIEDKEKSEIIIKTIQEKTLQIVNNFIDTYRFVTKEEYVTRLSNLTFNLIYFKELDEGIHTLSPNIESATMNRSEKEIKKIEEMLANDEKPSLYELLLLDAQNSFNHNDNIMAVVQSFQSLEIFLENFLISKISKIKSTTQKEAEDYITSGNNWRTKVRLKDLLKEISGNTLEEIDRTLWDNWCTNYDTVRNDVVHKGKDISKNKVENTLTINTRIIEILNSV